MKATELRIGNLVYYHKVDKLDERKEWDEVSIIDATDLKILTEYESNPEYKPIPLTEEWMVKFEFKKTSDYNSGLYWVNIKNGYSGMISIRINLQNQFFYLYGIGNYTILESVHQLQNIYFILTGNELTYEKD